ncbi:transposase [Mesorhizobium japonicum MAFF 303099]|uniref:Transposase n=1 Tax=Mesorhizobium japonicum (strain LMG 29417 / CECT 9101 / MAFF 303099) TaxID=266835 RepID=Q98AJ0_RHILO|nr:transposase [Mesorhizobium japonicum MAFF 303099]
MGIARASNRWRRDAGVNYDQLHHFIASGVWDAAPLEKVLLAEADRQVGGNDAWLIVDDTALPKKGRHSVGVAPQYASALGKNANCQTLVSLTLASGEVPVMVGLRLFVPESWTSDPARLDRAGVPEDHRAYRTKPEIALAEIDRARAAGLRFGCVLADAGYGFSAPFRQALTERGPRLAATHVPEAIAFATKPGLAVDMIRRALAADVPFSWVAADAVYGVGDVEGTVRRACKGYVLGVKSDHHFGSWSGKPPVAGTAQEIARDLDPSAWQRLSAGEGTKGARLHDWAYCELADLDADEYNETKSGLWTRGLLIRRNISDGDLAFFTTWCPAGTGIQTLVSVEGHRWAIEDSFEAAKNELGLDHNETRSWHGWHRHVSLVMLAFAMMAAIRYRANDATPQKRPRMPTIRI